MPAPSHASVSDAPRALPVSTPAPVPRAVGVWLAICAAMVFVMVVLGGATRLTESGLSITSWHPITRWLPPMSHAAWQAEFAAYRTTPEFQKLNFWMGLADYKAIFWLEYFHRLWGRLIGFAFALPLAWFWIRGAVRGRAAWRLAGILALGAAQGGLGWYMVESGLVNRTDVSQYRLAAHLLLAVTIYALLLWLSLRTLVARPAPSAGADRLRLHARVLLGWVGVTMLWGALVAGIDAGLAYNTFPLMDGHLVPPDAMVLRPWWVNFGENTATVQLTHRCLGIGLVVLALALAWRARKPDVPRPARIAATWVGAAALVQMGLGITTLLSVVALPIAILHQAGALTVVSLIVWTLYALGAPTPEAATRRGTSSAPAT